MRRRPHVLVLVVGAAAALLLSAPALGAAWLSPETAALSNAGTQQSPAIATDPAAPLQAAVVADDGAFAPPHTATTSTLDWSTGVWTAPGSIGHSGSTTAGAPDIAWGIDGAGEQNVYVAETGSASGGLFCNPGSGVFLSSSSNGGAAWSTAVFVNSASNSSEVIEPAIAVDRGSGTLGRIYVAYAKLDWAVPGCNGPPDSSQILLAYTDNEGFSWVTRRVSPLATTGSAHYRGPALAVLPDGRVIVSFRNDGSPSPQIEAETCTSALPPAHYCGAASAGTVGPSVVVGDATAPAVVSGVAGAPTPSVVAADGRATVAWHASTGGGAVRAFAAMSTDGGASFGPPQQIDPTGAGNQVAPDLAATTDGRVDVAYLWDASGTGVVNATSASAGPPLPGATTEAWGNPVVVQAAGASATTPISGQIAPLGRRLGIATANAVSPLPATVVAFTDTTSGSQDVHVVGLLHGTTAPVIVPEPVQASKNKSTIVHVRATDADGDPLTWSTGAQPTTAGSSVSTADPARGQFAFNAANVVGSDTFEAVATDGVPGHEARAMITVNVVNDPPEIICDSIIAREDTPRPILPTDCVVDPNNDPVTISLSDATGGTVERNAGIWYFVPKAHSTATGSFVLHASDGDLTAQQTVLVTVAGTIGKVNLQVPDAGKTRVIASGMALRLVGHAVDAGGVATTIFWSFGDHTPTVRGTAVAHRFRKPGQFVVKATSGGETRQLTVLVRRRAVELVGAPDIVDGVMHLTVRTRAAGTLLLRVDSRSQPIRVPAGLTQRTLRIQVTTGPLARLTLRLTPARKKSALRVRVFSLRRLVLVSPVSAG
ncbi:MAG: Bacterial Ig domain [Gaiellales bacterium]|nr:Bacterial Ig domain [Gaiellales bacterium]